MSDWQVGDLAVCVASGNITREGSTYTVAAVIPPGALDFGRFNSYDRPVLYFVGLDPPESGNGSDSARFRKIRPDEHESCEPEFVELLKRSKRRVSA